MRERLAAWRAHPDQWGVFRRGVALLGVATLAGFFLFADLGGTIRGAVLWPGNWLAIAIWTGPFVLYAVRVRSRAMSIAAGGFLLVLTCVFLVVLFRNQGSTAALGIPTLGFFLYAAAGVAIFVDRGWFPAAGDGRDSSIL